MRKSPILLIYFSFGNCRLRVSLYNNFYLNAVKKEHSKDFKEIKD